MAKGDAPEEDRWDGLRARLIVIALLVAVVAFLWRMDGDDSLVRAALPNADPVAVISFLIPAAFFLIPAGVMLRDARKVRRWPRVPGVVVSTAAVAMKGPPGSAARSRRPVVRYRYTAGGVERRGDTLWFGRQEGGGEGWTRKVLARYPVGAAVEVFCNPANPEQTSLEAAASPFAWAMLAVGLALLAGAVYAAGLF
jgi:hypothetical protein